jgi:hypothetical protein
MKHGFNRLFSLAAAALFAGSMQAAIIISDSGTTYTQDFNTLPSSGTNLTWANNSTISGWHRNYTGTAEPARDNSVQSTGANGSGVTSTQLGFMNTGVDGNTDRSVTLRTVSYVTNVAVGAVFQNVSGSATTGFLIGYTAEQWRRSTAAACSFYFEYAVVASINEATLDIQADDLGWTRVPALEFVSPNLGSGSGLNGSNPLFQTNFIPVTISATVMNGQYLVMRWLVNDPVNNHALGIDDVSVRLIPIGSSGFTAAYVVADFNDMARGAMTPAIQPGGTGQGFSSDHWETGTSVMTVTLGDLYAWTQTQYSVVQPGSSQCVRTTSGYDRRQARSLIPVSGDGHDIWFSFLVRNTEPTDVAGIDFLNDALSYTIAATNHIYLNGQSLLINGTSTDVSSRSFINENTLVVGKLTLGSVTDPEELSVWINPALSSKTGLEAVAPEFHSDDLNWNISQLNVLGICSYDTREESSEGGMLDAIRISNGTDAFDFIKATDGTLPTNEISRVPMDLHTPVLITNAAPAPGLRVKVANPEYAGTEVYHALYLPADWGPGKKYPVIVEYAGNGPFIDKYGDASSGAVESSNLGFGISGGRGFIWVCMPLVSSNHMKNELTWWGDIEASVDYCKTTVSNICRDFGGDSSKVFLAGFSRGAIACNYIGLHDDSIAVLWRGFICHSHYDGVSEAWPYPEADKASAAARLVRLGSRPQFISQENSTSGTQNYLSTVYPAGNFTFQPIAFRNHQDTWVLRDIPERAAVRGWINQVIREGSVDGGFCFMLL